MENKIIEIIENISGYNNFKNNIDIDLIENEIIDSLGFIELIAMLEDEFNVEIQPTQVSSDTWRSVGSITKLIISLKK